MDVTGRVGFRRQNTLVSSVILWSDIDPSVRIVCELRKNKQVKLEEIADWHALVKSDKLIGTMPSAVMVVCSGGGYSQE